MYSPDVVVAKLCRAKTMLLRAATMPGALLSLCLLSQTQPAAAQNWQFSAGR